MSNYPQKVWRNLSAPKATGCGYFVWELLEVLEAPKPTAAAKSYFIPCRDGSYIYIKCFHLWTKERAEEFMNTVDSYQELITN